MNNHTLTRADRATHIKIVAVSLIAGILVVGAGLAARPPVHGSLAIDANAVTVAAPKALSWSSRERPAVR
jgi:hypothetical protein